MERTALAKRRHSTVSNKIESVGLSFIEEVSNTRDETHDH
jgi:hypothetical protein